VELTYKQALFVASYLGDAKGNATEAARAAGYAWPDKLGPRLVGKSSVRAAIAAKLDEAGMASSEILARLSEIARADIGRFLRIEPDGQVSLDLAKLKKAGRTRIIKKIKSTRRTTKTRDAESVEERVDVELYDAQTALDTLAKVRGLYRPAAVQIGGVSEIVVRYEDRDINGKLLHPGSGLKDEGVDSPSLWGRANNVKVTRASGDPRPEPDANETNGTDDRK